MKYIETVNENGLKIVECVMEDKDKPRLVSEKTLFEISHPVKIHVKTIWDAHGREIPWEGRNGKMSETINASSCKLVQKIETGGWYDENEFETWDLYVDGTKVSGIGEICQYSYNDTLVRLKSVVGAG